MLKHWKTTLSFCLCGSNTNDSLIFRCYSRALQFVGDAVHKLLGGIHAPSQYKP